MMKEDTIEIVGFHAHLYFDNDSRDAAARVREGLAQFEVQLGRWHDKPIGPHPQAMYQVAFLPPQFGTVVPWLMLHREELNILVHPETGDDVADHTLHSLWLGEKLELMSKFCDLKRPAPAGELAHGAEFARHGHHGVATAFSVSRNSFVRFSSLPINSDSFALILANTTN
jgi:DOPA 4,5-dioxygenase